MMVYNISSCSRCSAAFFSVDRDGAKILLPIISRSILPDLCVYPYPIRRVVSVPSAGDTSPGTLSSSATPPADRPRFSRLDPDWQGHVLVQEAEEEEEEEGGDGESRGPRVGAAPPQAGDTSARARSGFQFQANHAHNNKQGRELLHRTIILHESGDAWLSARWRTDIREEDMSAALRPAPQLDHHAPPDRHNVPPRALEK
ncbi:hypothetical protein AAG570_010435 [Ranatra chinensis]|uniref:Uncharacterized protein n=1 Tax=Ranatra chinensis TaxID=642074 RepID=A0ABD0YMK6_9HEMI